MSYRNDAPHIWKDAVYRLLFSEARIKPIKKYVTLPAIHCRDIEWGINNGFIDPETTEILAFERNINLIAQIEMKINQLQCKRATVVPVDITSADSAIKDFDKGSPIDLMFIDFCGEMTEKVFNFIRKIGSISIAIPSGWTFCLSSRRNKWLDKIRDEFKDTKFKVNHTFMGLVKMPERLIHNMNLTISDFFEAHNIFSNRMLSRVFTYREDGRAQNMLFFTNKCTNPQMTLPVQTRSKAKKTQYSELSIAQLNDLYHAEISAGKKAAIKRAINLKSK